MAFNTINNSYVKFIKGSVAAWEALSSEQIRPDTLYFITDYAKKEDGSYDFSQPISTSLYLGKVLVSDGKENTILPEDLQLKLDHLIDVDIESYALNDKTVLAYSTEANAWIPQSIDTITTDIEEFEGSSSTEDGAAGLVPAPKAGDENKVLTGDGNWTELEIPDISDVESQLSTLIGTDTNTSVRDIVINELAVQLIPENAQESLDTLIEIAEWIQSHPNSVSEINDRLLGLEQEIFYQVPVEDENGPVLDDNNNPIFNTVSKIGDLEALLKDTQTEVEFVNTQVGDLADLLGATFNEDNTKITSLEAVEKVNLILQELQPQYDEDDNFTSFANLDKITAIEEALFEKDEDGNVIFAAAPIGDLSELLLVKNAQEGDEIPENLVDAINILTDLLTWEDLDSN